MAKIDENKTKKETIGIILKGSFILWIFVVVGMQFGRVMASLDSIDAPFVLKFANGVLIYALSFLFVAVMVTIAYLWPKKKEEKDKKNDM